MDELTTDTGSTGAFSRRDALRRGAFVVGAATLWTTPVVQTLGMRPAAADSHPEPEDICLTDERPNNSPEYRATSLTFVYLGDAEPASITLVAKGAGGGASEPQIYPDVDTGEAVTVSRTAGMNDVDVTIVVGGETRTFTIHTSCSSPLFCGETYPLGEDPGLLRLVRGTSGVNTEDAVTTDCSSEYTASLGSAAVSSAVVSEDDGGVESTDATSADPTDEAELTKQQIDNALDGDDDDGGESPAVGNGGGGARGNADGQNDDGGATTTEDSGAKTEG